MRSKVFFFFGGLVVLDLFLFKVIVGDFFVWFLGWVVLDLFLLVMLFF